MASPSTPSEHESLKRPREEDAEDPREEADAVSTFQPRYTTFLSGRGLPLLPQRNISSSYARSDITYLMRDKPEDRAILFPDPEQEGTDIIIVHPGSQNLRIGLASEPYPKTVPHCIARRIRNRYPELLPGGVYSIPVKINPGNQDNQTQASPNQDENAMEVEEVDDPALVQIQQELRTRMKQAKRRPVANAAQQVISFNTSSVPETIADHNDPYKVEWTEPTADDDVLIGDRALRLPPEHLSSYRVTYPLRNGNFNTRDYSSVRVVLGDLEEIWAHAIETELGISRRDLKNKNCVIVVPDLYNKIYVTELVNMLLTFMGFRGVLVHQESACATFGAGISTALVVDIGAQKTSIACVEDGLCLPDSRISLAYGGDDVTHTFLALLLRSQFPYHDVDLSRAYDFRLAEELKERWCTMNEIDIAVQVYDFWVRVPDRPTHKYQMKVYDEVVMAPMCLMVPAIIDFDKKMAGQQEWGMISSVVDDVLEVEGGVAGSAQPIASQVPLQKSRSLANPSAFQSSETPPTVTPLRESTPGGEYFATTQTPHTPQQAQVSTPAPAAPPVSDAASKCDSLSTPLDIAVAQSVASVSGGGLSLIEERVKKFLGSIVLVGGGSLVPGFDRFLADRLLATHVAQSLSIDKVEVLPPAREMDPRLLVWKGASVLSKLDTAAEMWIGQPEWADVGVRCLKERILFVW